MLEQICAVPVIGVVSYYNNIYIEEEEDSIMLQTKNKQIIYGKVNIAVILLHYLSNFNILERHPRVHLYYILMIQKKYKNVAQNIINAYKEGVTIIDICGRYQIMGMEICDQLHIEGSIEYLFAFLDSKISCQGYEIYMGTTIPLNNIQYRPLNNFTDGAKDGFYLNRNIYSSNF